MTEQEDADEYGRERGWHLPREERVAQSLAAEARGVVGEWTPETREAVEALYQRLRVTKGQRLAVRTGDARLDRYFIVDEVQDSDGVTTLTVHEEAYDFRRDSALTYNAETPGHPEG